MRPAQVIATIMLLDGGCDWAGRGVEKFVPSGGSVTSAARGLTPPLSDLRTGSKTIDCVMVTAVVVVTDFACVTTFPSVLVYACAQEAELMQMANRHGSRVNRPKIACPSFISRLSNSYDTATA
jgi:hypothetical protein